jgi:hypothetical protein
MASLVALPMHVQRHKYAPTTTGLSRLKSTLAYLSKCTTHVRSPKIPNKKVTPLPNLALEIACIFKLPEQADIETRRFPLHMEGPFDITRTCFTVP